MQKFSIIVFFLFVQLIILNQACELSTECNEGNYCAPDKTCQSCGVTQCKKCQTAGKCVECLDPYYSDANGVCRNCMQHCKQCNKATSCTLCENTYYYDKEQKLCRKQCITTADCVASNKEFCDIGVDNIGKCTVCQISNTCDECVKYDQCKTCKNFYYKDITNKCQSCLAHCMICVDATTCNTCQDQYVWDNTKKQCILKCSTQTECQDGNFCTPLTYNCAACVPNCKQCSQISFCDICMPSYGLTSEKRSCLKCKDTNCQDCSDAYDVCTKCATDYIMNQETKLCSKICNDVNTCPIATFCENQYCKPCNHFCQTCTNANTCTQCLKPNWKIQDGVCREDCAANTCEQNNEYCNKPINFCYTCAESGLINCQKCDANGCNICISGYTVQNDKKTCSACPKNCQTCDITLKCTKCIDNYGPLENCQLICNQNTDCSFGVKQYCENNQCKNCMDNCITCNNANICQKCITGYVLNDQFQCVKCGVENCILCDDLTTCKDCDVNYFLESNKKCSKKCEKSDDCKSAFAQYCNLNIKVCTSCISNCIKCTELLTCEICSAGFTLTQTKDLCEKCSTQYCFKCGKKEVCDTCQQGYYLRDNQCIKTCENSGTCFNSQICYQKQCISCLKNCKICKDPFSCDKCADGYHYDSTKKACTKECTINDDCTDSFCQNKVCVPCIEKCHFCSDASTCTQCLKGFSFDPTLKKCITACISNANCNDNSYCNADKKICLPCPDQCKQCDSNKYCQVCETGYIWNEEKLKCTEQCDIKTNAKYQKTTKNTIVECPHGQFCSLKRICASCMKNCQVCEDSISCKTCFIGYLPEAGLGCLKQCDKATCPPGTLCDSVNKKCYPCVKDCEQCSSLQTCSKCYDGFTLTDTKNQCMAKCSKQSECDIANAQFCNGQYCQKCQVNCLTCTSATFCTKCINNYEFDIVNKRCAFQCTTQTYRKDCCNLDDDITICSQYCNSLPGIAPIVKYCQPCNKNCLKCTATECELCTDKYTLVDKACQYKCQTTDDCKPLATTGYYCKTKDSSKFCSTCILHCEQCEDDTTCSKCQEGFGFNNIDKKCSLKCKKANDCLTKQFCSNEGLCTACIENCQICFNKQICDTCIDGYLPNYISFQCEKDCGQTGCSDGQYCNPLTVTDGCPQKLFTNQSIKFFLQHMPAIIADSESNGSTCQSCIKNCKSCIKFDECDQCDDHYKRSEDKKSCVKSCDLTIKCNVGEVCLNALCVKCSTANCKSCSKSQGTCEACQEGYELFDNACQQKCSQYRTSTSDCITGTYCGLKEKADTSQVNVCVKCIDNCNACSSQFSCSSCATGYLFDEKLLTCRKQCTTKVDCTSDEYCDNKCLPCGSYCSACLNGNACDQCVYGYKKDAQTQKCIKICNKLSDCSARFFCNTVNSECRSCVSNCDKCDNENQCKKCSPSFDLLDSKVGSCYRYCDAEDDSCPTSSYCSKTQTNQKLCFSCQANCYSCTSSTSCSQCNPGYFLNADKTGCINTCPAQQYISGNSCSKCNEIFSPCTNKCKTSSSCKTCFSNGDVKACTSCYYNCAACFTDQLSCTSCYAKNVWNNNKCVGDTFGALMKTFTSLIVMIIFYFLF